jgi:hypothetical protein
MEISSTMYNQSVKLYSSSITNKAQHTIQDHMYLIRAVNIAYCFKMITEIYNTCTGIVTMITSDDITKITNVNKQK